jgi:L-alanine-DL-glutamate epimerase-like enolase superfamily enzyme
MTISHRIVRLPFKYPFTISKGTKTHQPIFVVELEFMGIKGYGEAPAITYYDIPVEKMEEDLLAKKAVIEKFTLTDPERYWHFLHHLFPRNAFLVCALDMAGWDLFGKLRRKSLQELWKLDSVASPFTDYTIGIDTTERMIQKMKELTWPVYKIKMGFEGDVEMLRELRKHTDAPFRIDANAAWDLETALKKINEINELGVELVEQPLAKDDWEGMKMMFDKSPIPVFADEACIKESDVEKCVGYFQGINIKLTKCSGITPARRMLRKAKELGLKTMIGTMNESSLGSAAIAQLAPMADYLDMDGPLLLAEDIAQGITYDYGKITLTEGYGLGVQMKEGLF